MGERKVLNKYFPPDFDPALIPKVKMAKDHQMKIRMMLPMSVRQARASHTKLKPYGCCRVPQMQNMWELYVQRNEI